MNTNTVKRTTSFPLLIAALIAIIIFCGLGTAALMGWIPVSGAQSSATLAPGSAPPGPTASLSSSSPTNLSPSNTQGPSASTSGTTSANLNGTQPYAPPATAQAGAPPYPANVPPPGTSVGANTVQYNANAPAPGAQLAQTAPPPADAALPANCGNCGTVESVQEYSVRHHTSGVGLVAGALVGGLIGHQFFRGAGNVVSTVGGAAGGAYVGNKVEEGHHEGVRYAVRVRLEDGHTHVVRYTDPPQWKQGDRVRYEHGRLEAIG